MRLLQILALAPLMVLCATDCRAYSNVNQGCTSCHAASGLHTLHSGGISCTVCHVNAAGDTAVLSGKCVACHPTCHTPGTATVCDIVAVTNHNDLNCVSCHTTCASSPAGCMDMDGDGYYGHTGDCPDGTDCDDGDPSVHPGAQEVCGDKKDNNCDGTIDEGCSACPATKLFGQTDPLVETLRRFRDSELSRSMTGRKLINAYYLNAEAFDSALDAHPALRYVTYKALKAFANVLKLFR